jgi:hypothetical protein
MCCFVLYERVANHPSNSLPTVLYMITYIHIIKNILSALSTIVNKSISRRNPLMNLVFRNSYPLASLSWSI